jgi:ZIP family zinc transporter
MLAPCYTAVNWVLARYGAKHRKRSGDKHPFAKDNSSGGAAIAVGVLLDGIPESIVIGLSMLKGGVVSVVAVFRDFSPEIVAATTAVAAGAILAMLVDTMIPEAFEEAHDFTGLITVAGFLVAFILSKLSG